MKRGIEAAQLAGVPVEYRSIESGDDDGQSDEMQEWADYDPDC